MRISLWNDEGGRTLQSNPRRVTVASSLTHRECTPSVRMMSPMERALAGTAPHRDQGRRIPLLRMQAADSQPRPPIQNRETQRRKPLVNLLRLPQEHGDDRQRRREDGMERRPLRPIFEEALTVAPLASHATSGPLQVRDVRRSSRVGPTRPERGR